MIDVIHFTCWSCYCCGVLHQQWCDAVSYSTYNMDAERCLCGCWSDHATHSMQPEANLHRQNQCLRGFWLFSFFSMWMSSRLFKNSTALYLLCFDSSTCFWVSTFLLIYNTVFTWRQEACWCSFCVLYHFIQLTHVFFVFFFVFVRLHVISILTGWVQSKSWTMTTSWGQRMPSICLSARRTGEQNIRS